MRILMIEYEKTAADYATKGLSESGHVCAVLADETDGLFQATRETYDVIVADRMLPGLDGLSMVRGDAGSRSENSGAVLDGRWRH